MDHRHAWEDLPAYLLSWNETGLKGTTLSHEVRGMRRKEIVVYFELLNRLAREWRMYFQSRHEVEGCRSLLWQNRSYTWYCFLYLLLDQCPAGKPEVLLIILM